MSVVSGSRFKLRGVYSRTSHFPKPLRETVVMHTLFKRLLVAASCAALLGRPALAQNTITLEGSVKGDGAPIAGAQITVVNVATREAQRTITRASGEFRVLGLFSGQVGGKSWRRVLSDATLLNVNDPQLFLRALPYHGDYDDHRQPVLDAMTG